MSNISEHKAVEYYLRKKPDIDEMIIDEVVDNGIAFIPCADDIPTKYPIALAICGHKFISEEQKIIAETIKDHFTYELGLIRRENKNHFILFYLL